MAIKIQQITLRSIGTLLHKLFALIVAGAASTVNYLLWSPLRATDS
jgi:hypothetical protein